MNQILFDIFVRRVKKVFGRDTKKYRTCLSKGKCEVMIFLVNVTPRTVLLTYLAVGFGPCGHRPSSRNAFGVSCTHTSVRAVRWLGLSIRH